MSLAHRLEKCYSGAVYDVLRAMGRSDCVLPQSLRPLDPRRHLAGPVFTLTGRRDDTLDDHETLLAWTGFLSKAPPDHVVVCQPNDHELALMGELSAETLQLRRVRGCIIDGGCRDTDFILQIGFKVFCTHHTPVDVVGRWIPTGVDEAIEIGGVAVRSGDYVLGDRDGVVVIPAGLAEEVTDQAEAVMRTESLVRKAILAGEDPQQAYLQFGKF